MKLFRNRPVSVVMPMIAMGFDHYGSPCQNNCGKCRIFLKINSWLEVGLHAPVPT